MSKKAYGLIIPKTSSHSKNHLGKAASIFGDDSSGDERKKKLAINKELNVIAEKKKQTKQTKGEIEKALKEDPSVYEYDEIYEQLEEKKITVGAQKIQESKKPKYIASLLKSAAFRQREQERRVERTVEKERQQEGDEFADKEAFVTSAYRQRMLERAEEEARLKQQDAIDAANDVTKMKDLSHFYRHLLDDNVGKTVGTKKQEKVEEPALSPAEVQQKRRNKEEADSSSDEDYRRKSKKSGRKDKHGEKDTFDRSRIVGKFVSDKRVESRGYKGLEEKKKDEKKHHQKQNKKRSVSDSSSDSDREQLKLPVAQDSSSDSDEYSRPSKRINRYRSHPDSRSPSPPQKKPSKESKREGRRWALEKEQSYIDAGTKRKKMTQEDRSFDHQRIKTDLKANRGRSPEVKEKKLKDRRRERTENSESETNEFDVVVLRKYPGHEKGSKERASKSKQRLLSRLSSGSNSEDDHQSRSKGHKVKKNKKHHRRHRDDDSDSKASLQRGRGAKGEQRLTRRPRSGSDDDSDDSSNSEDCDIKKPKKSLENRRDGEKGQRSSSESRPTRNDFNESRSERRRGFTYKEKYQRSKNDNERRRSRSMEKKDNAYQKSVAKKHKLPRLEELHESQREDLKRKRSKGHYRSRESSGSEYDGERVEKSRRNRYSDEERGGRDKIKTERYKGEPIAKNRDASDSKTEMPSVFAKRNDTESVMSAKERYLARRNARKSFNNNDDSD